MTMAGGAWWIRLGPSKMVLCVTVVGCQELSGRKRLGILLLCAKRRAVQATPRCGEGTHHQSFHRFPMGADGCVLVHNFMC